MSIEVVEQRREEMLREAEANRLVKELRAEREVLAAFRWASAVGWEIARAASLLRKSSRALRTLD